MDNTTFELDNNVLREEKENPYVTKILLIIALILGITIVLLFCQDYILVNKKPVFVSNPSFEDCLGAWGLERGSMEESATCVDDVAYDGEKSIRVDFKNVSWIVIPHDFHGNELKLLPKKTYIVEFYVRSFNMTKICIGYDENSPDDRFLQWYSCIGGVITFPADGKWHKIVHKFNTNRISENNYGVFKFDISGCDRNDPSQAPYCEGELNSPGTIWIDGPVKLWLIE